MESSSQAVALVAEEDFVDVEVAIEGWQAEEAIKFYKKALGATVISIEYESQVEEVKGMGEEGIEQRKGEEGKAEVENEEKQGEEGKERKGKEGKAGEEKEGKAEVEKEDKKKVVKKIVYAEIKIGSKKIGISFLPMSKGMLYCRKICSSFKYIIVQLWIFFEYLMFWRKPVTLFVVLPSENIEASIDKAVSAGATAVGKIRVHGSKRTGKVKDPYGHIWMFKSRVHMKEE